MTGSNFVKIRSYANLVEPGGNVGTKTKWAQSHIAYIGDITHRCLIGLKQ